MKRTFLTLLALVVCASLLAQERPPRPGAGPKDKPEEKKEAPAPVNLQYSQGLFSVAQNEKDWYLEIPDALLGRRLLAVTRYAANTMGAGVYGGEEVNDVMLYWEKAPTGNLLLRVDVVNVEAPQADAIAQAVRVSSENPIVASFKPEKNASAGTTRIKANSLFEGDLQIFSLDARTKKQYNLGGIKNDASFIQSIRTYPINTEVTVTKTYGYNQPTPGGGPGAAPSGPARSTSLPAGREAGVVTIVLNTSIILLPEEPMQQRWFDARVGYFAGGYTHFSDEQQGVEQIRYITRWRLGAHQAHRLLHRPCYAQAVASVPDCRCKRLAGGL